MQLARITFAGCEPVLKAFFKPHLQRLGQGAEEGFDGKVITHGIAFHQAAHAADVAGAAVGRGAGHGESHLVPADGAEVGLHRHPAHQAISVRI